MSCGISFANIGSVKGLVPDGVISLWHGDITIVNIGSGNGLVPDGTKPLSEPIFYSSSEALWHLPQGGVTVILQDMHMLQMAIMEMCLKITQSYFPGADDIDVWQWW